jgi:uracil-DNA glycosylase
VPDSGEIATCAAWLRAEVRLLRPQLVIPIGKLAIQQFLPAAKLADMIGQKFVAPFDGQLLDVVPLPHPSGASPWHRMEPGRSLLQTALELIARHPAWKNRTSPTG